jgi:hypothetical protein
LIQNEIELAKRELAQKASQALVGILLLVAAIFMACSALDVLIAAAVAALVEAGLAISVASLIVAGAGLVIASGLVFVGKARLDPKGLKLEKSARNLRKDINTIKENAHV